MIDLGGGTNRIDHVVVTALDAPLDETADDLAGLGYTSEPVPVGPWTARATAADAHPEHTNIVLLDGGERTVMVESGDLPVPELLDLAATLEPTDDGGWAAAGGTLVSP